MRPYWGQQDTRTGGQHHTRTGEQQHTRTRDRGCPTAPERGREGEKEGGRVGGWPYPIDADVSCHQLILRTQSSLQRRSVDVGREPDLAIVGSCKTLKQQRRQIPTLFLSRGACSYEAILGGAGEMQCKQRKLEDALERCSRSAPTGCTHMHVLQAAWGTRTRIYARGNS